MTAPTPRVQIIENASSDDIRPGDHITWERTEVILGRTDTIRREGIAHDRNSISSDWWTKEGGWLTDGKGEGITLTIRRTIRDLPTKPGTVIITNDGHESIRAVGGLSIRRAREAVLGPDGRWYGVWRGDSGVAPISYVVPELITPGTWKVDDR